VAFTFGPTGQDSAKLTSEDAGPADRCPPSPYPSATMVIGSGTVAKPSVKDDRYPLAAFNLKSVHTEIELNPVAYAQVVVVPVPPACKN
jgi:hypothetical protein